MAQSLAEELCRRAGTTGDAAAMDAFRICTKRARAREPLPLHTSHSVTYQKAVLRWVDDEYYYSEEDRDQVLELLGIALDSAFDRQPANDN